MRRERRVFRRRNETNEVRRFWWKGQVGGRGLERGDCSYLPQRSILALSCLVVLQLLGFVSWVCKNGRRERVTHEEASKVDDSKSAT